MFAGEVRNLRKSGAPERCSPHVGSGLTHKHQPSLMFAGKVTNLGKSGIPERCFAQLGSDLAYKH